MQLVSEKLEFRRVNVSDGKNGNKNYYYTFEDENGSFQLFSRNDLTSELVKGQSYSLIFNTRLWNGSLNFNLQGIYKDEKSK